LTSTRTRSRSTASRRPPGNDRPQYNARLNTLSEIACSRIEDLVEHLDVPLARRGNKFMGRCPVHGGDNPDGMLLFPEGATAPGYWRCQTRGCQQHFRPTITGFVHGVLSHRRHGWEEPGNRQATFREAINWLCDFIGQPFESIRIDDQEVERRSFEKAVADWNQKKILGQGGLCTRDQIRALLDIPSPYYLGRGYRQTTLDRYDVGVMTNPRSVLHNRVVVPIYDEAYKMVVGAVGRTLEPECGRCRYWHGEGLPCPGSPLEKAQHCKWRTSSRPEKKFVDKDWLYNYWFSSGDILRTRCAVLVEGPGDVWRLDEAGVKNSVAIFGADLSSRQVITLECSGCTTVIALTDRDQAGEKAARSIEEKCSHFATVYRPDFECKDIGEMTVDQVRARLAPFIASKARRL
jgi:5S rRNA maturation endonuclease (ribonuclease M5)